MRDVAVGRITGIRGWICPGELIGLAFDNRASAQPLPDSGLFFTAVGVLPRHQSRLESVSCAFCETRQAAYHPVLRAPLLIWISANSRTIDLAPRRLGDDANVTVPAHTLRHSCS